MNPISYGLKRIRQEIPPQILSIVFTKNINKQFVVPVSVDSVIRQQVITERVLVDCNLAHGAEITVALASAIHEQVEPGVHVYRIPKQLTQNRNITSALSVAFSNSVRGSVAHSYGTQDEILNASKQHLNSLMSIQPVSDARCSVIGDNVVMVEHADNYLGSLYLRCVVENDANMNHLNPRSWDNFAQLCVLACKGEIYTNSIVELDRGYTIGGSEIGEYKNTIERYSDANETYRDFLKTTWSKTAILNDPEMRDRLIRITSGGAH